MSLKGFVGKYRSVWLVLLLLAAASVLYPFMTAGEFVGGKVTDSRLVHSDSLFGPKIYKVTLDSGIVTYVKRYPWYYFHDTGSSMMEITGVVCSNSYAQSDVIYVYINNPLADYYMTFTEQNLLYREGSFAGLADGPKTCVWTRLRLYEGRLTGGISAYEDSFRMIDSVDRYDCEYEYGETWETTLCLDRDHFVSPGVYEYTVGEWMADTSITGILTDMCWVEVTVPVPEPVAEERQRGSITVNVWDNRVPFEADFAMYKDGEYVDTYHTSDGSRVFPDLEFGSYSFRVVNNPDFETIFYDANPCQADYDFDDGVVELNARLNTINYVIFGDFTLTDDDPYGEPDSGGWADFGDDDWDDAIAPYLPDVITGSDGDGDSPSVLDMIVRLLASLGLFAVVLLGLPLFLVIGFAALVLMYWSSGGERDGK